MNRFALIFLLHGCYCQLSNAQQIVYEDPRKLADAVNSAAEETMPLISNDGTTLYFARILFEENVGGENAGRDIWYSSIGEGGSWTNSKNDLVKLNNKFDNAIIGIGDDEKTFYLLNSYKKKGKMGVSVATLENRIWSAPTTLSIPGLESGSGFYGFYMHPEGKILMVSMEGPNSNGQEDIYVCLKGDDGKWSEPINLGTTINSEAFEITPFLNADASTLYFSTDGREGLGSADVYVSERMDDTWTNWSSPENLKEPINSAGFDAFFSLNPSGDVFFASNRSGLLNDIFYSNAKLADPEPEPKPQPVHTQVQAQEEEEEEEQAEEEITIVQTSEPGTAEPVEQQDPVADDESVADAIADILADEETVEQTGEEIVAENPVGDDYDIVEDETPVVTETENIESIEPSTGVEETEKVVESTVTSKKRKLYLVNHRGDTVMEATVNSEGFFQFQPLPINQSYVFLFDGADDKLTDELLILLIDQGGKEFVIQANQNKENAFKYEYIPTEASLDLLEEARLKVEEEVKTVEELKPSEEKAIEGEEEAEAQRKVAEEVNNTEESTSTAIEEEEIVVRSDESEEVAETISSTEPEPVAVTEPEPVTEEPSVMFEENPAVTEVKVEEKVYTEPVSSSSPVPSGGATELIYFDHNSSYLGEKAQQQLRELSRRLPAIISATKIEVTGYSDNTGEQHYNLWITERRANRVIAFLAENGIEPSVFVARWRGAEDPLKQCSDCTDKENEANRRVEIIVR